MPRYQVLSVEDEPFQDVFVEADTLAEVKEGIRDITKYPLHRIRLYNKIRQAVTHDDDLRYLAKGDVIFYAVRRVLNVTNVSTNHECGTREFYFRVPSDDRDDDLLEDPVVHLHVPLTHGCEHLRVYDEDGLQVSIFGRSRVWEEAMVLYLAIMPVTMGKVFSVIGDLVKQR